MKRLMVPLVGFFCGLTYFGLPSSHAIDLSWDGGGGSNAWFNQLNWNPTGSPTNNDLTIGDNYLPGAGPDTRVNVDLTVASVAIENSSTVDTDGNRLVVNGATSLTDAGTVLRVRDYLNGTIFSPEAMRTDTLFVGTGATVEMYDDAVLQVDDGLFTLFGTLQGNGELQLDDLVGAPLSLFNNSGTLSVGVATNVLNPPARTLRITRNTPNARIDLDGNGSGVVNLQQNATLDIDVMLIEPFTGVMNLGPNSTIDVADPWTIDGQVNVNTSTFTLTAAATITGDELLLASGGTITIDEADEELRIAAPFSAANGSAIANSGIVRFDAPAQFTSGADFQLVGNFGSMVVNSNVTILQDSFDVDGNGQTTNQVTVNTGALLVFNGGNFGGGDLKADGVLNINGGEIVMDPQGNWTMDGTLNMNGTAANMASLRNSSGTTSSSQVFIGDGLGVSDANIVVGGDGVSQISYRVIHFRSDANVDIAAGAVLDLAGITAYEGANATYDGAGTFNPGVMGVSENTTFNIAVVDLDHSLTPGGSSGHNINARLTINADSIDSDGDGFDGQMVITNDLVTDHGELNIHIPGLLGSWRFDSGEIRLVGTNPLAVIPATMLDGSDIEVGVEGGSLVVEGWVRSEARLDIQGDVQLPLVSIGSPSRFVLAGGDSSLTNRLSGGVIDGPNLGTLHLENSQLHGFGTIDVFEIGRSPVASGGPAEVVMADDGILTITGDITELDVIGVTDDGVLNVTTAWFTANINDAVVLEGGEITGHSFLNSTGGLVRGHGLITAAVQNEGTIRAEGGGTLILDPATTDNAYDGLLTDEGRLWADSADMILRGFTSSSQTFSGRLDVDPGLELFVDGFRLEHTASSQISLANAIYRVNHGVTIGGEIQLFGAVAGPPSRIVNERQNSGSFGLLTFASTANIELGSGAAYDLELESVRTEIEAGATFSGVGSLVNLEGSRLELNEGANVGVSLISQGILIIGNAGVDDTQAATASSFTQTATGELQVDLAGLAPGLLDHLTVDNNAILDGTLAIDLVGAFTPLLGNSFTILETTFGNVGGMFAIEDLPVFNDLTFDVIYNPQSVVLEVVVATFAADFDNDGDVDGDDLAQWQGDFGGPGSDADDDGDSDGADFLVWQRQFGSGVPELAVSRAVPEPSTIVLLCVSTFVQLFQRRQFAIK